MTRFEKKQEDVSGQRIMQLNYNYRTSVSDRDVFLLALDEAHSLEPSRNGICIIAPHPSIQHAFQQTYFGPHFEGPDGCVAQDMGVERHTTWS